MKYTPKRFECLLSALDGKDYPSSDGIRRILEKDGLLVFNALHRNFYGHNYLYSDVILCGKNAWSITKKGKRQLNEWIKLKYGDEL